MHRRLIALGTAWTVLLFAPGLAPAADAAPPSESHADSQFVDGTLLAGDLSNVAGIAGAHADHVDGQTPGASTVRDAELDVTALRALEIALPALTLQVGDLLDLGAVTQHAEAGSGGTSSSTTRTENLDLDLLALLGSTPVLSQGDVHLGAVQSTASLDGASGDLARRTTIADATLGLRSPTVAGITDTVNGIVGPLNTQLNGLQSTITGAVNNSVGQIVNLVGAITGAVNTNTRVTVNSRLDAAVARVLDRPLSTDLVTLDPSTGSITVKLAGGIDLNNVPPNTTLLDADTLQRVSADVATLLGQLQSTLNDVVTDALDYVDVTITSTTNITAPVVGTNLAGLTIGFNGTLQDLLDGSAPLNIAGTGLLAVLPLAAARGIVQDVVGAAVSTALGTAVAGAGTAVDNAVTGVTNALRQVLTSLGGLAQVNLNVQNDSDGVASRADVTAVQAVLLPGAQALTLNLARSSVGPNAHSTVTPAIDATDDPVPAGSDASVAGTGWIDGSTVTLQLVDPAGDPAGDPVTVTTDGSGAFPAGTSVPVPAGSAPGAYTVRASDSAGNTATDTITVPDTTAPDVRITAPADGERINDRTPAITGTTDPGSDLHVAVTNDAGTTVFAGDPVVGADGGWSIGSTSLPEGDYTVTATATDDAGNTATDTASFTVDTTAPAVAITRPAGGVATSDPTPTIAGTTDPGSTVHVVVTDGDGATVFQGDADVAPDGGWTIDAGRLPDGDYTATATATDPAGNTADDSAGFTVDTAAPPVSITSPADGTTTSDTTPTITGTTEPGADVHVVVTDGDGTTVFQGDADVAPGGGWTVDAGTLPDGDYTVTATATDPAGNTGTATSDVTVDSSAPAIDIAAPTAGSSTDDTTPTISGTTDAGSSVHVVVTNGSGTSVFAGDPAVGPDGGWTIDTSALPDGTYTVRATATDAAGNTADDAVGFSVDTTAPVVSITSPADGDATGDTTPTITGTVDQPDADVHVVVTDGDGTTVFEGDAEVGPGGGWSIDSGTLPEGDLTVTVTATDPAGNTGTATSGFTVDTTDPAVAVTAPADGGTTGDRTPTISGTTEPGATVHVVVADADGATVFDGDATVAPDGNWTIDSDALADGDYTATATATDPAGNTGTDSVGFTVDTTAPPVAITAPADGSSTDDRTPTVSGLTESGATVHVVVTDADGAVEFEGDATVAPDGTWTIEPAALPDGEHTITATATDAAGNTGTDNVTVTVDTTAPPVAITTPADGSTVADDTPTITGTTEAGASVHVVVTDSSGTNVFEGDADVARGGAWTIDATHLPDGDYTVTATATDPTGNTGTASSDFTVDAGAPSVAITTPADGSSTADATPAITGTTDVGARVHVVVTDPSGAGVFEGDPVVGADGGWTIDSTRLPDGDYTVTATATDLAGNTGTARSAFTVDTAAPDAPVITRPADGSTTTDPTPTITGTGEPGATVTVSVDGKVVGTAVVAADGTWTLDLTTPLASGQHTVTATQTDPAGNASRSAAPVAFTLSPAAPGSGTGSGNGNGSGGSPGGQSTDPSAGTSAPEDDDNGLAATGAAAGLPLLALLGVAALAGGMLLVRRRRDGSR